MKRLLLGLVLMCGIYSRVYSTQADEPFKPLNPKDFYLGVTSGYSIMSYTEGMNRPSLFTWQDSQSFNPIKSDCYFVGIATEYFIPDNFFSFSFKTYYINQNESIATLQGPAYITMTNKGDTTLVPTEYSTKIKSSFINSELLFSFPMFYHIPLSWYGGIGVTIPLNGKIDKRLDLLSNTTSGFIPDSSSEANNFQYENENRTIVFKNTDIFRTQLYTKFGLQYNLYINDFQISTAIFYNWGLTKVTHDENFRTNSIQFVLDIKFAL